MTFRKNSNMKFLYKKASLLVMLAGMLAALPASAGNPDRAGSAGVGQLLINPWARSAGLANSNMSSINGIESSFLNVAGLAFVNKTELVFSNSNYLGGTDIQMNAIGFAQRMGESSVLGISVAAMSFGDLDITTEDLPEGGLGTFSPIYANIGISYAKEFSNSIFGGITLHILSEAISNVRAQGIAFDAGIRYVTGARDHVKFGIALKNVGPPMRYKGDGMTVTATIPSTGNSMTVEQRSEKYEMPSLVNIGVSYDFLLSEKMRLTMNGQFTSNSFTNDQFGLAAEFSFNERFILRGGYAWEDGLTSDEERFNVLTGPTGGVTLQVPVGANETNMGIDYSYRASNPFSGIHSIGLHIDL
jgi:hypothetical protein